jgi:hypothetical protein
MKKRTLLGRIAETILLLFGYIFALTFCACYLVGSVTRDMGRLIAVWSWK